MSGECDTCGEHCLDCKCSQSITVNVECAFSHAMMPYENSLAGPIPIYVNQLFGKIVEVKHDVVLKCCGKSAFDCVCVEVNDGL